MIEAQKVTAITSQNYTQRSRRSRRSYFQRYSLSQKNGCQLNIGAVRRRKLSSPACIKTDKRYQIFGYSRHVEDLWKLDQVVYSARRMCKTLKAYELGKPHDGAANMSNREVLRRFLKR